MRLRLEVFDLHHQVIFAWAEYRRTLKSAPLVLTLDHHADTLPAFGRLATNEFIRKQWIQDTDFRRKDTLDTAIDRLHHDEHLDFALETGIISQSLVISHSSRFATTNSRIIVTSDNSWPDINLLLNDADRFRPLADQVFEEEWLHARLSELSFDPELDPGFILDLDLDYVLTEKALRPNRPRLLRKLIRYCGLVTISRETDWLRLLRLDPIDPETLINQFYEIASGVMR